MKKLADLFKKTSQKLAKIQVMVMLFVYYFLFLLPFSIIVKIFYNPLSIKLKNKHSNWHNRKKILQSIEDLRNQF